VTASAGDHGLVAAFAAPFLGGIPVTVFVLETAAPHKVPALEAFDVYLERAGQTYAEAQAAALTFAQRRGAFYLHAYGGSVSGGGSEDPHPGARTGASDPRRRSGTGGQGQLNPCNRPGLPGPCPRTRIIGMQTEVSSAPAALLPDRRLDEDYPASPTLADGPAGGVGAWAHQPARKGAIRKVLVVREETLLEAIQWLAAKAHLIAEGSSAVGIVALRETRPRWAGERVAVVLSGSDLGGEILQRGLARHLEGNAEDAAGRSRASLGA
jgi:threonine dehydratase